MKIINRHVKIIDDYSYYQSSLGTIIDKIMFGHYLIEIIFPTAIREFHKSQFEILDDSFLPITNSSQYYCNWCGKYTKVYYVSLNKNSFCIRYCINCLR